MERSYDDVLLLVQSVARRHGIHDKALIDEVSYTVHLFVLNGKYINDRQAAKDAVLLLHLLQGYANRDGRGPWVVGTALRMICLGFEQEVIAGILGIGVPLVDRLLRQVDRWLFPRD